MAEIEKHNTARSCWLLIDGKVYDVTDYKDHPGEFDELLQASGKDATDRFNGIGHSDGAKESMADWLIGELSDTPDKPAGNNGAGQSQGNQGGCPFSLANPSKCPIATPWWPLLLVGGFAALKYYKSMKQ